MKPDVRVEVLLKLKLLSIQMMRRTLVCDAYTLVGCPWEPTTTGTADAELHDLLLRS